ncbi:helix-turn-helix domain-containing protein, partial [Methylopila musalis]
AAPAAASAFAPDDTVVDLDSVARGAIAAALEASGGNVAEAARKLGVSRSTLYRRGAARRAS